ncbi:phosphotransferase-like protein [Anaerosporobacter faecicola]|uniref:phosphotransferase-like protein n=1 Tax=Anaerosporobacter faecicola TaxID=2718714 RepID=UPI00143A2E2A|nr:AAA family ATPase [Anaerosporobacter faecicola]
MKKSVIVLNGPSSSGKSTLVDILKKMIKEKKGQDYASVSIDDFLKMSKEEVIYEDDVYEISPMLCNKVREYLDNKTGVIIDHVITSERIFAYLQENLADYHVYLIQVTCPLEVLNKRERERGNRCIGSAEASYQYLYPKEGYDRTIDTYKYSTEECASQILDLLEVI